MSNPPPDQPAPPGAEEMLPDPACLDPADHRRLGVEQDLFHFEEEAPGMVFWHPRGLALYRALEQMIRAAMRAAGYEEIRTPQLLPRALWERSGHWEKFGHAMFCVPGDTPERALALKPMSCPAHAAIFNSRRRSWRALPFRVCEFGACHRDEPSGALHGLLRTRAFEQDDAHVACTPAQMEDEVGRIVGLVQRVYAALGFPPPDVALALRPDLRAGTEADWDWMEQALDGAARAAGLDPVPAPGEGAFYGPKLEFRLHDRWGRAWQCGTIQLDRVLPGRLGMSYVDPSGGRSEPILIHHAIFGSLGRIVGILLEHHAGRLPAWLAPDQVALLPVASRLAAEAARWRARLEEAGIRVRIFPDGDTLGRRLVEVRRLGIPAHIVLGDRECAAQTGALSDGGAPVSVSCAEALARLAARAAPPRP